MFCPFCSKNAPPVNRRYPGEKRPQPLEPEAETKSPPAFERPGGLELRGFGSFRHLRGLRSFRGFLDHFSRFLSGFGHFIRRFLSGFFHGFRRFPGGFGDFFSHLSRFLRSFLGYFFSDFGSLLNGLFHRFGGFNFGFGSRLLSGGCGLLLASGQTECGSSEDCNQGTGFHRVVWV